MANLYRTWGIPEYLRIREELRNASIGPGYSIRLLERLSMVTYKMKNLAGVFPRQTARIRFFSVWKCLTLPVIC